MTQIQDDDVDFSVGMISNLFGTKTGTYRASRILDTFGIKYKGRNKAEHISSGLRTIARNPHKLAQVVNTLIKYHSLSDDEFGLLATAVAPLDLRLEEGRVIPGTPSQKVYKGGLPFDAFKDIEAIIESASSRVSIIDPYVDDSLFPLYFTKLLPSVELRIITRHMCDRFKEVAKKFKAQHKNLSVRKSVNIHDRHVIVDDRAWSIGQSIKDAGNKPLTIIELTDPKAIKDLLDTFDELWNNSTTVI